MEYAKGEWKVGWGSGLTGPTTQAVEPVCGGRDWPVLPISIGTETVAICPAQDLNMTHQPNIKEMEANAHLIVTVVNACIELNPDNPMAVAESIKPMYEALKYAEAFCEAVGQGLVAIATRDMVESTIKEAIALVEGRTE